MAYEAARFHEARYREHGDRLEHLAALIREGFEVSDGVYDEARRVIAASRERVGDLYKATPVILVPAAPGRAPFGLAMMFDAPFDVFLEVAAGLWLVEKVGFHLDAAIGGRYWF